ncbi:MAG TPA: septum formation initiator family protein [Clostridia bacterium]|nr:septum formation initiator family protein [Clostridia bacterium]
MAVGKKRKKKGNFIKRNFIAIAILLVLGSYFLTVLIKQNRMYSELKAEEARVLIELAEKEQELERLEKEIEEAGTDGYVEKLAREELDLVKENDIVYHFKENEEDEESAE